MHRSEERPLLISMSEKNTGSDEEAYSDSKYGKPSHFKRWKYSSDGGRSQGTTSGASKIIKSWPDHLAVCWMSALGFCIFVIVCIVMLESSLRPTSHQAFSVVSLQQKCIKRHQAQISGRDQSDKTNVYLHIILNDDESIDVDKFEPMFVGVRQHHPQHKINVFILHNDTFELGYRRSARFKDWERHHMQLDQPEFFDTSSAEEDKDVIAQQQKGSAVQDDANKFENVNIVRSTFSAYFLHSPLRHRWRIIPPNLIPLTLRVLTLWEHGGITMPWQLFVDKTDVYCAKENEVNKFQAIVGDVKKAYNEELTEALKTRDELIADLNQIVDIAGDLTIELNDTAFEVPEIKTTEKVPTKLKMELKNKDGGESVKKVPVVNGTDPNPKPNPIVMPEDDDDDDESESSSSSSSSSSHSKSGSRSTSSPEELEEHKKYKSHEQKKVKKHHSTYERQEKHKHNHKPTHRQKKHYHDYKKQEGTYNVIEEQEIDTQIEGNQYVDVNESLAQKNEEVAKIRKQVKVAKEASAIKDPSRTKGKVNNAGKNTVVKQAPPRNVPKQREFVGQGVKTIPAEEMRNDEYIAKPIRNVKKNVVDEEWDLDESGQKRKKHRGVKRVATEEIIYSEDVSALRRKAEARAAKKANFREPPKRDERRKIDAKAAKRETIKAESEIDDDSRVKRKTVNVPKRPPNNPQAKKRTKRDLEQPPVGVFQPPQELIDVSSFVLYPQDPSYDYESMPSYEDTESYDSSDYYDSDDSYSGLNALHRFKTNTRRHIKDLGPFKIPSSSYSSELHRPPKSSRVPLSYMENAYDEINTLKDLSKSVSEEFFKSRNYFREKKQYVQRDVHDDMNIFTLPHRVNLAMDKYGYYFSSKKPCHAFLGQLISALQSTYDLKSSEKVMQDGLSHFCRGRKYNNCAGISLL